MITRKLVATIAAAGALTVGSAGAAFAAATSGVGAIAGTVASPRRLHPVGNRPARPQAGRAAVRPGAPPDGRAEPDHRRREPDHRAAGGREQRQRSPQAAGPAHQADRGAAGAGDRPHHPPPGALPPHPEAGDPLHRPDAGRAVDQRVRLLGGSGSSPSTSSTGQGRVRRRPSDPPEPATPETRGNLSACGDPRPGRCGSPPRRTPHRPGPTRAAGGSPTPGGSGTRRRPPRRRR